MKPQKDFTTDNTKELTYVEDSRKNPQKNSRNSPQNNSPKKTQTKPKPKGYPKTEATLYDFPCKHARK